MSNLEFLGQAMESAFETLMAQTFEPPGIIYCTTDFYREMMRRTKHIRRMHDWKRCTYRKVRVWKGRKFSFMVPDTWMLS